MEGKPVTEQVTFAHHMLRLRGTRFGVRIAVRPAVLQILLVLLAVALAGACLLIGDYPLTLGQVFEALSGQQTFARVIVLEWRLPAAVSAVFFGALLGTGGAVFQVLTHNPLGSPDVIGFDAGAYTAVVMAMLLFGARAHGVIAAAAVGGGLLTALIVHLLSGRGRRGFRLVVAGLAVSSGAGCGECVILITRARVEDSHAGRLPGGPGPWRGWILRRFRCGWESRSLCWRP